SSARGAPSCLLSCRRPGRPRGPEAAARRTGYTASAWRSLLVRKWVSERFHVGDQVAQLDVGEVALGRHPGGTGGAPEYLLQRAGAAVVQEQDAVVDAQ